ncbi:MAG: DMT family transporter [Chloroflexi bacterium]|nr:DMT family transporter [Chloroflexota bacterium]
MENVTRQTARGGALFVALGAALWGTDAVLRVPLVGVMGASAIVLAEHLILLLYAVPAVALGWSALRRLKGLQWGALVLIAWGGSGLATVLFTAAFATGNPTTVILLQKAQPLFAITLARLLLREQFGRMYWPLFAVAMVGAYLVSFESLAPFWLLPTAKVQTAALALGAALLWGSSTVFGRFILSEVPFPTVTGARFLLATPFLAALATTQGRLGDLSIGFTATPANLVLLAAGPGLISLLLYYRGLSTTRASVATLAELAFPATAVILNWAVLNRPVAAGQIAGFCLLWAAIVALDRVATTPQPRLRQAAAG